MEDPDGAGARSAPREHEGRPGVAIAQLGGHAPSLAYPVVAVGPEGGWGPGERALGLPEVGLGASVLRAETAAVTAAAFLTGLRAGTVVGAGGGSNGDRG
jgi:hypothetical protein